MAFVAGLVTGYVMALLTLAAVMINRQFDFDELFPRVIFADKNTVAMQLKHIRSECDEVVKAFDDEDPEHTDEEVMDLMHSCKTYFDIRKGQGVNPNNVRQLVIDKNKIRRYYLGC